MQKLDLPIPETGTLTKVAADLYWARFALPFRLNHINLYMIDTDAGWLLVDAGINQDETAAQWQMLLDGPLSHQAVAGLLVTHHHVDHLGYAGALSAKLDIPVYTSASEADFLHDEPIDFNILPSFPLAGSFVSVSLTQSVSMFVFTVFIPIAF